MSSKAHNKKRNVGLLYEFLVRIASAAVVEGNVDKSALALELLKKHFEPGSPLHREFRLFNSLMKVQISSPAVATSVLREAREAAKSYDVGELQKAKTRLINEMNRKLDDPALWDIPIPDYRVYATIGTLISEWRAPTGKVDIERLAEYEDKLVEWLVQPKDKQPEMTVVPRDGTERLALRLALRKFNDKYSVLLPEQKDIIRLWALSQHSGKPEAIQRVLRQIREDTVKAIDEALADDELASQHGELREVKENLGKEILEKVDDSTVKNFMLYTKLRAEIRDRGREGK